MSALPRLTLAAAHKSSGKTLVTTGLAAALAARGERVASFKKGPDYIDPMWQAAATGRPCYNLDFNTQSHDQIRTLFADRAAGADIALIEANKGLFDGVRLDGADSNAALTTLLRSPVVLVIDTRGMTRGIAPLLQGYMNFDPDVQIAGVILNRTGGARHEGKLRAAVEEYCGLPVLGAIGNDPALDISERHLGLVTPAERADQKALISLLGARIGAGVDLERIMQIARAAPAFGPAAPPAAMPRLGDGLRIGIARDAAFGFYYADDLERIAAAGAALIPIDMTRDRALPEGLDGLVIGGGFPETQAAALSANAPMREGVRAALEDGLPCYAECGGLMYLCRSITWHGAEYPMVGFIDGDAVMHDRPQGRGYVRFAPTAAHPWGGGPEQQAHEFHYASVENLTDPVFARSLSRGAGTDGRRDGLVKANTLAGFIHLRQTGPEGWVSGFLNFAARIKQNPALKERGLQNASG